MICDQCETVAHCLKNGCVPKTNVQQCNHCNGSGRMVRDPDIGTDQECFVCDGSGAIKQEQPAPVAEPRKQEPCCHAGIAHDCHAGPGCRIAERLKASPQPAQQQEPEWIDDENRMKWAMWRIKELEQKLAEQPAQRQARSADTWVHATTWRGLTDEEIMNDDDFIHENVYLAVRSMEAKLREKNT